MADSNPTQDHGQDPQNAQNFRVDAPHKNSATAPHFPHSTKPESRPERTVAASRAIHRGAKSSSTVEFLPLKLKIRMQQLMDELAYQEPPVKTASPREAAQPDFNRIDDADAAQDNISLETSQTQTQTQADSDHVTPEFTNRFQDFEIDRDVDLDNVDLDNVDLDNVDLDNVKLDNVIVETVSESPESTSDFYPIGVGDLVEIESISNQDSMAKSLELAPSNFEQISIQTSDVASAAPPAQSASAVTSDSDPELELDQSSILFAKAQATEVAPMISEPYDEFSNSASKTISNEEDVQQTTSTFKQQATEIMDILRRRQDELTTHKQRLQQREATLEKQIRQQRMEIVEKKRELLEETAKLKRRQSTNLTASQTTAPQLIASQGNAPVVVSQQSTETSLETVETKIAASTSVPVGSPKQIQSTSITNRASTTASFETSQVSASPAIPKPTTQPESGRKVTLESIACNATYHFDGNQPAATPAITQPNVRQIPARTHVPKLDSDFFDLDLSVDSFKESENQVESHVVADSSPEHLDQDFLEAIQNYVAQQIAEQTTTKFASTPLSQLLPLENHAVSHSQKLRARDAGTRLAAGTAEGKNRTQSPIQQQASMLKQQHSAAVDSIRQTRRQLEMLRSVIVEQQSIWGERSDDLTDQQAEWLTAKDEQQQELLVDRQELDRLSQIQQNETAKHENALLHRESAVRSLEEKLQQTQVEILRDRMVIKQFERTARQTLSNAQWNERLQVITEETDIYLEQAKTRAAEIQQQSSQQIKRLDSRQSELLLYRESLRNWVQRQMKLVSRRSARLDEREDSINQRWADINNGRQNLVQQQDELNNLIRQGLEEIDLRLDRMQSPNVFKEAA